MIKQGTPEIDNPNMGFCSSDNVIEEVDNGGGKRSSYNERISELWLVCLFGF